jgi:hypothetical protein
MGRVDCFCAFCKSSRKVYTRRRIGGMNILAAALGAIVCMFFLFQEFDPRVFLLFVLFLAISEVFVQIRWRMSMVCKHCGFDPVLYLKSHELAAEKVKKHLESRKNDPATLLKPPLQLPKIRPQTAPSMSKEKGSLLNRQIE